MLEALNMDSHPGLRATRSRRGDGAQRRELWSLEGIRQDYRGVAGGTDSNHRQPDTAEFAQPFEIKAGILG